MPNNTNMEALRPEFWFGSADGLDRGSYGLPQTISSEYSSAIANKGDTVHVPVTPDFGEADKWDPNSDATVQSIAAETVPVQLKYIRSKRIELTSAELSMSSLDLVQTYGVPMAESLLRSAAGIVYRKLISTPNWIDASGTMTKAMITSARTALTKLKVPSTNRVLMAAPDDYGTMLDLSEFSDVQKSADPQAISKGILMSKLGFDIGESHAIDNYTPSDITGAVNNAAGYTAGTKVIEVDAFADSANPVRQGDIVTFAGHATKYRVVGTSNDTAFAEDTAVAATTQITLDKGLTTGVADDVVITVTPGRSMLAYVPSAAAFAARAFAPQPGGFQSQTGMIAGLPVRITIGQNPSNLKTFVQYDTIMGCSVVNSNRIVALHRAAA